MEDYILKPIRAALILTTSYVAGTVIDLATKYDKIALLLDFTKGSLTSAEYKIEFSPDNVNWYQEVASGTSTGTITDTLAEHTIGATGKYRIVSEILDRYMRVSAKGTGIVTGSSLQIDTILADTEN